MCCLNAVFTSDIILQHIQGKQKSMLLFLVWYLRWAKQATNHRESMQTPSTAEILYFHQHARLLLGKRTKVTLFTKETSGKHALFPSKGFYYALQDMRVGERNTSPGPARPTDCSWTETNTENPVSCSVRRRTAVTSLRWAFILPELHNLVPTQTQVSCPGFHWLFFPSLTII